MSLNTAQLEYLSAQGMTLAQVIELSRLGDIRKDPTAADRMRDMRERRKRVTRNVTNEPPKEELQTPASVSNETVGEPTIDPVKQIFDLGPPLLMAAGKTNEQARSIIGKLRKQFGDPPTLIALIECRQKNISNPVEWLPKRLSGNDAAAEQSSALILQADRYRKQGIAA